ncbi:MAG: neuraminidase-like domain-containing protein, partial [Gemmatimonadota bacterium]|nr:neuraminidase-like domain-containing protein [Gemmatimonadota bacterium]
LLDKVVEQTSWNRADLELLAGASAFALTLPDDLKNEKALLRLRDCFAVLKRLGMSAEHARNLSAEDVTPDSARAARQAVRARYDDAGWPVVAKPLRDVLREKQRSALVDYLVAQGAGTDANELYGRYLIDVEMDPCMMTSRIKQAISSVQQFVQRCLLNLESEVLADSTADDAWDWWKWMKSYRVWEANRKVFLYPENWIEPELRTDKSPFFKELESALLQSDLTPDSAEAAFLGYLEKLDQVSRLEVMAIHYEKDDKTDILHVFARTPAPPRAYYYRRRVNSAYWTPWEKMDVDIEGGHLIPVIWNGRLFLFWPIFTENVDPVTVRIPPSTNSGQVNAEPGKYWDVKLAWSERKQSKWTGKKVSSGAGELRLNTGGLADLSRVFFAPSLYGNDLSILQLYVTTLAAQSRVAMRPKDNGDPSGDPPPPPTPEPPVPQYVTGYQNEFYFGGCYLDPVITRFGSSGIGSGQNVLVGTERAYMSFREPDKQELPLSLPVRVSVDNSQVALARTPGRYTVTSQDAQPRVARTPFLYQDPWRDYLVIPKVSWWDDVVVDPSEIGGVMAAERPVPTLTPPAGAHNGSEALVASTTAASTGAASTAAAPTTVAATTVAATTAASTIAGTALAPGISGQAVSVDVMLGPDTHVMAPFVLRSNTKYSFNNLYHPYICALLYTLNRQGVDQMLGREMQRTPELFMPGASGTSFNFESVYGPSTDLVATPYPIEEMDFSFSGSYSSYNWELFFHAPLLIADRLSTNQRFEEATRWFHYIFNPTDASGFDTPKRYWQTKEFFDKTDEAYQQDRLEILLSLIASAKTLRQLPNPTPEDQAKLRRLDDLEATIKAWRDQPFDPHLIARTRTTAYQKTVVMKYIDNLIAWGDQLFRRDTLESINEATQLYVTAAEILGDRPVEVPPRLAPRVQTYNSLAGRLDEFSNALVELEDLIPVDPDPSSNLPEQPPPSLLYFGLPKNDKLLGYWDTVADRLFKIRHCMNFDGVVRQLPLFEPPIDPALLVRGAAAGLDISSMVSDANVPLPSYRFSVLAQKTTELCGELRSLGGTLLATLEKRDGEELSLLRARHETGLLEMIEQIKEEQLEEAAAQSTALTASRNVILGRLAHYQRLLGDSGAPVPAVGDRVQEKDPPRFSTPVGLAGITMFPHEVVENVLLTAVQGYELVSAAAKTVGAVLYAIPEVNAQPMGVGVTSSGGGNTENASADATAKLASAAQVGANLASRLGGYVTRELDWVLQHNQAARELTQIDKQIIGAEIRVAIAGNELQNHRKQMADSREVEEFMRDKYTNQELYSWMVGQVSGVYFQMYQLAYETAKRTEQCYRHELGLRDGSFIQFGSWDSLKKGLMAGEKLHHDLKRMELAYLENNARELELTKHVSLEQLDPLALVRLRETGRCVFRLPEEAFDLDYPGHYFRRMKSVSLTLPCVVGPYTTISCTLRLLKNSIRIGTGSGTDGYPRNTDGQGLPTDDNRFVESLISSNPSAIAASNGQNDSGMFELNFRDERYLPFEGAGAISEWELELFNDATNPDFGKPLRQFDYGTISDAILHVKYTAREEAGTFKDGAVAHLRDYLSKAGTTPSLRLFNLRQEFPSDWQRFLHPANGDGNTFELELTRNLFPYRDNDKTLHVNSIALLARCTNVGGTPYDYHVHMTLPLPSTQPPAEVDMTLSTANNEFGGLYFHQEDDATLPSGIAIAPTDPAVTWRMRMTHADGADLLEDPVRNTMEVEEALVVVGYEWMSQ